MEALKQAIRDIPDFPKEGILFKDITPALEDRVVFRKMIDALRARYKDQKIDAVAGIEARGFVMASALAYVLGAGLVLIRKPGKLPYQTHRKTYALEYGTDAMEIHVDSLKTGQNVLLVDDVLATGGTIAAAVDLIQSNFKANIVEVAFMVELDFLKGREKLKGTNVLIHSMVNF